MTLPTTRKEALALGLEFFNTGKPCASGHTANRKTSSYVCVECGPLYVAAYRAKHPERVKASVEKLKGYHKEYSADWYRRNKEKVNARNNAWRSANVQRNKQINAAWKRNNPDKAGKHWARRRAMERLATPPWADLRKIAEVYDEAKSLRQMGLDVHVDHIFPLLGAEVCGLHVHNNMHVMLAVDNLSKGNRISEHT